jgi:hypothetical protein
VELMLLKYDRVIIKTPYNSLTGTISCLVILREKTLLAHRCPSTDSAGVFFVQPFFEFHLVAGGHCD